MSQQDVEPTDSDQHQRKAGVLANVRIVSLLTMASRLLGLLRDIGMAILFGNGVILDSFSVAFRIPNLARGILGEGALSTAFLPTFLNEERLHGTESAFRLAATILGVLFLGLFIVVSIIVTMLSIAIYAIPLDADLKLLLGLMTIIFPYILLICSAAQVNALLHAKNHFFWPAFTPILLNCVWLTAIVSSMVICESPLDQVYLISASLLIGGLLQLTVPIPEARRLGLRFSGIDRTSLPKIRAMFLGMMPIILGLSISQLNALCDSFIAWGFAHYKVILPFWTQPPVTSGTASALYFGQRMYQFPLGVFGVALGTVLYPRLTRHAQSNNFGELRGDLSYGLRLIAIIGIPASAGLVLLSQPLTAALFEHGAFNAEDSQQTSQMITAYGTAVWAFIVLLVIHRGFYALDDRMTPVRVGLLAVGCNFVLNFVLMLLIGSVGLAYATSIATMLQAVIVFVLLERKIGSVEKRRLAIIIAKTLLATATMLTAGALIIFGVDWSDSLIARFGRLMIGFVVSMAAYVTSVRILGVQEFFALFSKAKVDGDAI